MNLVSNFLRMPAHRRVDVSLVVALVLDAIALAVIAAGSPHPALGGAVAAIAGLGGLWCVTRTLDRWYVRPCIALALVAMVFGQIGLAANPRPWMLNALLTLSLLPAMQRGSIVLAAGLSFAIGGPWIFIQAGQLDGWSDRRSLVVAGFMIVQALLLARVARRNGRQLEERFDIEFLVRAMGTDGPIRLGLDAVKAESTLGRRLKHVQQRMADAIRHVHHAALGVRAASQELDASGDTLRERTEHSAEGLRDAAMTLEQISVIVQSSAQAALEAREMAASASRQAEEGGAVFSQVTHRMHEIDAAARRITDVIGVIDGIAFQTNILALNAAVEAARAGEQGRGFAVVAAEVRNLALRSSTAAAEIKQLIGASLETVQTGNALVDDAAQRMIEIVASVRQVGQVFESLSADTNEHAGSIEAVTSSVKELDAMTRQNVVIAETTQRIAGALLEQSAELEQVLGSFKLGDLPAEPPPAARPPAVEVKPLRTTTSDSAARRLAEAVIVAAAKPRPAPQPPAAPEGGGSNVTFF